MVIICFHVLLPYWMLYSKEAVMKLIKWHYKHISEILGEIDSNTIHNKHYNTSLSFWIALEFKYTVVCIFKIKRLQIELYFMYTSTKTYLELKVSDNYACTVSQSDFNFIKKAITKFPVKNYITHEF